MATIDINPKKQVDNKEINLENDKIPKAVKEEAVVEPNTEVNNEDAIKVEAKKMSDQIIADRLKEIEDANFNKEKSYLEKLEELKATISRKDEENNKIIQALSAKEGKDDIIAEIENNRKVEKEAEAEKARLEELTLTATARDEAIAKSMKLEEALKQNEDARELEKEVAKFKQELAKEALDKPWLAQQVKNVLATEDYETQKQDYRFIKQYFDTEETKNDFLARKNAGASAFSGTRPSTVGNKANLDSFIDGYMNQAKIKHKY